LRARRRCRARRSRFLPRQHGSERPGLTAAETIYTAPRGAGGEVSEASKALAYVPRPPHAFEIEDLPNTYAMKTAGYWVTYGVAETPRLIILLLVEKEERLGR
jgi:hypothetical protein